VALALGAHLGPYEVLSPLGSGGMGEVYEAVDTRLNRRVAVKVLRQDVVANDDMRRRFQREAIVLSKLNHPNIATLFDFGTHEGVVFLVMEYITGPTLAEVLTSGPVSERETVRLGIQLAEGLLAAHTESIVHRDLKPKNLRFTPEGRLKILDFGLATLCHSSENDVTDTSVDVTAAAGTLPYMAPEQLLGRHIDNRVDIYAAGAVLYEMATGKRAFPETQRAELIEAILGRTPVSVSKLNRGVSPGLSDVVDRLLDKNPARRYQSARPLLVDLERLSSAISSGRTHGRHLVRTTAAMMVVGALTLATLALTLSGLRDRITGHPNLSRIRSVAVLPLANVSNDSSQDYFADGMTEELIATLGRIGSLKVISRTSIMQFKGSNKLLPEIARTLNVDAILEGSVLMTPGTGADSTGPGKRVRIDARLIYAGSDTQLWSKTFEEDLTDVLAMQSEVARAVAREIDPRVSLQEPQRASLKRQNVDAQDAYLLGRYYLNNFNRDSLQTARDHLKRALELDPTFARAYASLARCYMLLDFYGVLSRAEAPALATAAAASAVRLDASVPEGQNNLADVTFQYRWDWAAAEAAYRQAIALNPSYSFARSQYARFLMGQGRLKEALQQATRAAEDDPLSSEGKSVVALAYYYDRKYDEAIREFRDAVRFAPTSAQEHLGLGRAYAGAQKFQPAIDELQQAVELSGQTPFYTAELARTYAAAGRTDQARTMLAMLESRATEPQFYVAPQSIGYIYAALGEEDRAFSLLNKAVEERAPGVLWSKVDPRLDVLHSERRFRELIRRLGLTP